MNCSESATLSIEPSLAGPCKEEELVWISCLVLEGVVVLNMPGELFIQYQLQAQQLRSSLVVEIAAYDDYGAWLALCEATSHAY